MTAAAVLLVVLAHGGGHPLEHTEGGQTPAVSADGEWVAFWSEGSIRKVRLSGGPAQVVVPARGRVWMLPSRGLPTAVTTTPSNLGHRMPWPLPGGRAVLYTVRKRLWTWGDEEIRVQPLPAGQPKLLLRNAADARYVPTHHLVFLRQGTLYAVSFDADRLELRGPEVAVRSGVAQSLHSWHAYDINGAGQLAVSATGMLAWLRSSTTALPLGALVDVDRTGRYVPLPLLGGEATWLAWSPNSTLFFDWRKDGVRSLAAWPADADETVRPRNLDAGRRYVAPAAFTSDGRMLGVREDRE